MIDDDKFNQGLGWIGGIVAALVIEAVIVKIAQRVMPGLFSQQQQPQIPQQRRRR